MASNTGAEVAQAYLTLLPTMKGAQRLIEAELGKVGLDSIAKKASANFGSQFTKGLGSVATGAAKLGSALTRNITLPAIAATSAIGGIVLAKGFKRVAAIDQASSKLIGLRHDAESTKDIMNSALESVLGTAYGMDAAATTAAGAVAAGVAKGKDLTNYLINVGDAAAIAGVPMEEMGQIFNRTQTQGRAYAMELNMLADRGLPIYQWIAKEAGIAADEVREMAREGEVSSELYFKAIEKNIGGAAKLMGENSFSGVWANTWAAVSRIGANILGGQDMGGLFEQLKPQLVDLKKWLGDIEVKAKDWGKLLGAAAQVAFVKFRELLAVFKPVGAETRTLAQQTEDLKASVTRAFDWIIAKVKAAKTFYDGLSDGQKKLIWQLPLIAAAAGPALIAFGKLATAIAGIIKLSNMIAAAKIGSVMANSLAKGVGMAVTSTSSLSTALNALSLAFKGGTVAMSGMTVGLSALAFALGTAIGKPIADYLVKIQDAEHQAQMTAAENAWLATSIGKLSTAYGRATTAAKAHKDAVEDLKDAQSTARGTALTYERALLSEERAQNQVTETLKQYGAESLEYREAMLSLQEAQDELTRSKEEMANAAQDLASKNGAEAKAANELASANANANNQQTVYLNEMRKKFEAGQDVPEAFRKKFEAEFQKLGNMNTNRIGEDLINGVISGLNARSGALSTTADGIIRNNVRRPMVNAAMIKSPSKMTAQIGAFISEGLVVGMKSKLSEITQTAKLIINKITSSFADKAPETFTEQYLEQYRKMTDAQKELDDLQSKMPDAPVRSKGQSKSDFDSEMKRYREELAEWKKEVQKNANELRDASQASGKNLALAFAEGITEAIKATSKGDASSAASALDELVGYTRGDLRVRLLEYQKVLDTAATAIDTINNRLDEQKEPLISYKSDIKQRFSDFSADVFSVQGIDAADYLAALEERLDASRDYAAKMQQLAGIGLSQTAIDKISSMAIDEGSAIMDGLLSGADAGIIERMNAVFNATREVGSNLGDALGSKYIQPGIDSLESELKTAQLSAESLGAGIAEAVREQLNAAGNWGQLMVDNIAEGIRSAIPAGIKAAEELAEKIKKAAEIQLFNIGDNAKLPEPERPTLSSTQQSKLTENHVNNIINVSLNVEKLKDIQTVDELVRRLNRAEATY